MILHLGACDLNVSNPGPVADDALDENSAHLAVVNGMGRTLARALGYVAYTSAVTSREIVSAGHRNPVTLGISAKQAVGILDPGWEETNDHWKFAQQARWVAEDGVRRIKAANPETITSTALGAQALLYAGFANRLLGENMCDAVFDGGPIEPRLAYFERAQAAFTDAMSAATAAANVDLLNAARAGRASVRVWLGDWDGAMADAALVPLAFSYRAVYSNTEQEQFNRIFAANLTTQRAHSVVGTYFESYFRETGDKRVSWSSDPAFPKGTADVLWYFQTKYTTRGSPINLASGREMRLIIAEGQLRKGDATAALATINALRAASAVAPRSAASTADLWTVLGRERGIELWLEGRHLGDLFRWKEDNVPGTFDDMTGRDRCFPIGVSELDANPNF
jgi:hypothetical protein